MTYSSTSLEIQRKANLRRNQNSVRYSSSAISLGPVAHTILLAVMLCVLGLIYLTQVTKTNAYGYQLNDLKEKKEALIQENQALQVESAQLQSLERVKTSGVSASLTSPATTSYIQN